MAKPSANRGKSPPTPERQLSGMWLAPSKAKAMAKKSLSYKSDGVQDHDILLLPTADYLVALGVTVLAAIVRIFRIYQPSSVVFDEVQCVLPTTSPRNISLIAPPS